VGPTQDRLRVVLKRQHHALRNVLARAHPVARLAAYGSVQHVTRRATEGGTFLVGVARHSEEDSALRGTTASGLFRNQPAQSIGLNSPSSTATAQTPQFS
jgi:hypothetical protein